MIMRLGRLAAALCATLCASVAFAVQYSGPITITAGGTYTGNWRSDDPAIPAVKISTSQPVTIVNSNILAAGRGITQGAQNVNLTVRHSVLLGRHPGVADAWPGRNVSLENARNFVFEHNHVQAGGGVYLLKFTGNGTASETIKIRYNVFRNIEGRRSLAGGLWSTTSFIRYQAVQFNQIRGLANVEVAWNHVYNEPWYSRVEDNINIYLSSGTAVSPMRIHNNFIHGAYPANPVTQGFSGGGIITDGSDATVQTNNAAYVTIEDNQVVAASNYGVAIAAGYGNTLRRNRVIASGWLPDGQWIKSQNVGAYVRNLSSNPFFANNEAYDNVGGWRLLQSGGSYYNNAFYLPNASFTANNVKVSPDGAAAESNLWVNKLVAANIVPGPSNLVTYDLTPAADAGISAGSATTNYGAATTFPVKSQGSTTSLARKTYYRFNLGGHGSTAIQGASLRLTLTEADWSSSDTAAGLQFRVYGLNPGSTAGNGKLGADWAEGSLHWNNAPANNTSSGNAILTGTGTANGGQATLLQTLHLQHPAVVNGVLVFSGHELDTYLNAAKGGPATLIITRVGGSSSTNTSVAMKEHTSAPKPRLGFLGR